jgi:hypothetical protein
MCSLISKFIRDQRGTLLITEWVFLTTILVIAVVPLSFTFRDRFANTHTSTAGTVDALRSANHHGR